MESFQIFLAALPYLTPLIEKGFQVVAPNGMTIKTLDELEVITDRIAAYNHLTPEPGVLESAWDSLFGKKE